MTAPIDMRQDQGAPAIPLAWYSRTGLINFASGWTFAGRITHQLEPTVKLADVPAERFTGSASSPNLLVDLTPEDLADLTPGTWGTVYTVHIHAVRTSDTADPPVDLMVYDPGDPLRIRVWPAPEAA